MHGRDVLEQVLDGAFVRQCSVGNEIQPAAGREYGECVGNELNRHAEVDHLPDVEWRIRDDQVELLRENRRRDIATQRARGAKASRGGGASGAGRTGARAGRG